MTEKDKRILHSIAVAEKMKELAKKKRPDDDYYANDMYVLGLLHDIGYLVNQKRPAVEGGLLMMRQGYKYWETIYSYGNPNSKFRSEELELLNQSIDALGEV